MKHCTTYQEFPLILLYVQRIYHVNDKVFRTQLKHVNCFENGEKLNSDSWFSSVTSSHLRQFVWTSQAAAEAYFDKKERLGTSGKCSSFFKFIHVRLEGSNVVIRLLRSNTSSTYTLGNQTTKTYDSHKCKIHLHTRNKYICKD